MQTHLILIHGAWQGSWVWQLSLPYFKENGFICHAIDLPGNGSAENRIKDIGLANININSYANQVSVTLNEITNSKQFNSQTDKIVIVAHSGGGVVATQVAQLHSGQVDAVIYLAGMMLPPNISFKTLLTQLKQQGQDFSGIETYLNWNSDYSVSEVPAEFGAKVFLNDLPFEQALKSAKKLTPQATTGLAIEANYTLEALGLLPRLYVECTQDKSVKLAVQRIMQRLVPGASRITLQTGHAPHVSQPELTVNVITGFLNQLWSQQ